MKRPSRISMMIMVILACYQGSMLLAKDKTNKYDARVGIVVVINEIEKSRRCFKFCFVSIGMDKKFHSFVDQHTRTHDSPSMQVTSIQEFADHDRLLQHGCS